MSSLVLLFNNNQQSVCHDFRNLTFFYKYDINRPLYANVIFKTFCWFWDIPIYIFISIQYKKNAYLQQFQVLNGPQMQHPLSPSWDICNRAKQEIKTVSWCFNWLTFCKAWPESSLVVVEELAVGCFAVVILLAYVRLLALAQSAQRRCHRTSTRNTAGTEKSADICQRRRKNKSGWGTENPDQKWKHIYGKNAADSWLQSDYPD